MEEKGHGDSKAHLPIGDIRRSDPGSRSCRVAPRLDVAEQLMLLRGLREGNRGEHGTKTESKRVRNG